MSPLLIGVVCGIVGLAIGLVLGVGAMFTVCYLVVLMDDDTAADEPAIPLEGPKLCEESCHEGKWR